MEHNEAVNVAKNVVKYPTAETMGFFTFNVQCILSSIDRNHAIHFCVLAKALRMSGGATFNSHNLYFRTLPLIKPWGA